MYQAMKEEVGDQSHPAHLPKFDKTHAWPNFQVEDVEEALSDVQEMMRTAASDGSSSSGEDWHVEWTATVQRIAEQDAGWAWAGFWDMVERNLTRLAAPVGLLRFIRRRASQLSLSKTYQYFVGCVPAGAFGAATAVRARAHQDVDSRLLNTARLRMAAACSPRVRTAL